MRVMLLGGRMVVLDQAAVAGDSLVGLEGSPPQRRAVALRDVARVEDREFSTLRTLVLVYLVVQALSFVAFGASLAK